MSVLEFSIPRYYVLAALRGPQQNNVDIPALLIRSGILEDVLHEPLARVSAQQYTRLIQNIWQEMDDEYMGLGQRTNPVGSFSMMCHAVIHCPNLEKALKRAFRFYGLFTELAELKLVVDDEYATITVDESKLADPDNFLIESIIVIWHRFGSWLIGRRIHLQDVYFRFPKPVHHNPYPTLFNCNVEFDSSFTGMRFPVKFLSEQISQNETSLNAFIKQSPANLLAKPEEGNSLVARIRSIIGDDLSKDLPNFDAIANALHTSPQTLRRRLKEEGVTYQELKDQMRRDTALFYLERGDLSIQAVAEKLGFSESSTFHRAFKKWTGMTPGAYRQHEDS
jgi:AraC-like DNA-binding protein